MNGTVNIVEAVKIVHNEIAEIDLCAEMNIKQGAK